MLFIGGDFPRKGGPDLLEAWRVGGFCERAELYLVTDWPLDCYRLPRGVVAVRDVSPHTAAWLEHWRRADVFAMPTRHEAFGLVYQEAAAAGLPVVATSVNAVPEIVVDRVTGLLVPPADGAGLVRALRTLIEDPVLRDRMGAAAFTRIRREASPDQYADRLSRLIGGVRTR